MMKKTFLTLPLVLCLLAAIAAVAPGLPAEQNDFHLADLQYQLNKAKGELQRIMSLQTKESKKELERLRVEIDQIRKEIEEMLKKESVVLDEEDRNLKQYLVQYKVVTEQLKIEIDTTLKIEKIQIQHESESLKADIPDSKVLLKSIATGNTVFEKRRTPAAPKTIEASLSLPEKATKQNRAPTTNKAPLLDKKALSPTSAEASTNSKKEASSDPAPDGAKDIEEKMVLLGDEIKSVKEALSNGSGSLWKTWVAFGKANLESEHYLKSLKPEERYTLIQENQYTLGSYEIALLSFNRALELNPGDPEMHYLLGETYGEIKDGLSASNHLETARQIFKKNGNRKMSVKADEYAQSLRKKYAIQQEHQCGFTENLC